MKKIAGFFIFLVTMSNAFSETGPVDLNQSYSVVSDYKDKKIKKGTYVIEGVVKMSSSGFALPDVMAGMIGGADTVMTDSLGRFRVVCNTKTDSVFYLYKEGWSEINIADYPFKDQHRITISAYLSQEANDHIKRKPVIYLYSDKDLNATVKVDPKGTFTFTYPDYGTGWNVRVNELGGITDLETNKNYPYLFWEAKSENLFYQTTNNTLEGFVINTDTTIQFLEEKLSMLGLNEIEKTDFITFWGPILQKEQFALVQFLVDDAYESEIAGLQISPQPDAIRRVFMLWSPVESENTGIPVTQQKLTSFERSGFTVVEWGGSEIDLMDLKPH